MLRRCCVVVMLALVLAAAGRSWGARQPAPKIEILQPQTGQALGGLVDVRLKLPAQLSGPVYVGLGGPPWARLERVPDASEGRVLLDSRMVPNGPQKLIVKTPNKRADAAVDVTVGNPLQVYFSDLHSHTGYSDGVLLPSVAHDYARNVSRLDVFTLTDHLEYVDDTEWLDIREAAWDASEDGKFVSIPGLEWTKKIGHINMFDPPTNRWPADLAGFYQAAADAGVVCKFNHPGDGTKVLEGLAYSEVGDRAVELMEVRRASEEQAYLLALKLGWHLAPDGSDDTHGPTWGSRFAWSGILAPGLSKRNILDALKKRHCYSTLDRDCILRFKVNGAVMGDIIAEPTQTVEAVVTVRDPNPGDTIDKIELFENGSIVQTDEPKAVGRRWTVRRTPQAGRHYYFVKITQADGNLLWSAPVWLTVKEK